MTHDYNSLYVQFCVQLCEIPFQEACTAVASMRVHTGAEPSAHSGISSDRSINQISSALRGAHVVLIAYDASAGSSFGDVDTCVDAVSMLWPRGSGSMALVACKSDIRHTGDASHVTDEDIRAYCTVAGLTQHWQCSYKRGTCLACCCCCSDNCPFLPLSKELSVWFV